MRKALLVAAAVIGLSGPVEAESSNFGYNLSNYDTCAGLLLSVSWRLEAVGENELSKHYKNGADTHGITAVAERHTMNDPTDTYEHMLITAHAFANVLNTEGTHDVVRKCDAMVPVLKEVNRAWGAYGKAVVIGAKADISSAPLVVILHPGEPFGQSNVNNNRNRSGDRDRASADAASLEDNAVEELDQLRDGSAKGDADSQYELAELHRLGLLVEQDYAKSIELYNRSADQGFAASQYRLGDLYEEGEILERDLGKAVEWYRKAAEQEHPGAQYALAHIYHLGSGVEQDMAAAIVWYRKAALQGNEWSQLALGDQYRIGLAVPRDLIQSTKWYRKAAERGNIFAQFELGNAYRYGNSVDRDVSQAIEWYRLSAEAGNPSAELALRELEADDIAAARVTPQATAPVPELEVTQDADSDVLASASVDNLAFSETAIRTVAEGKVAMLLPEREEAPQSASSAPVSDAADPNAELAYATEPPYGDEEEVSLLLAHAQDQVAKLALTTPEGDNAYETYQLIRSLQPNNQAALDGIKQIGAKYAELAKLAAKKGNLRKANHYAAKAAILAPVDPRGAPPHP